MRSILVTLVIAILFSCQSSQKAAQEETNSIFLVRHAEKADDGTKDPPLTAEGLQRASNLAVLLKGEQITRVFSTDYKRTKLTAEPSARSNNLKVEIYNPRDLEGFSNVVKSIQGENILIVGHSNSTPSLANAILGKGQFQKYDESDYDNLITIVKKQNTFSAKMSSF